MKKIVALGVAAGLLSLTACNSSPREQAADNIEANTEAVADNMEDAADNVATDAAEANIQNAADAVRATGQNQAEDMRTHDADTNLKNGM
jgi:deoxyinosine 3'endonuclease (endonuclease V)